MTGKGHVHSLDECVFWLPSICRRARSTPWERRFAEGMLAKAKRPGWVPTPKQLATMRRLVGALFEHEHPP